ncbi:hypothetical protein JKP88DRAFT_286796 [Tribonema minus]|uniref:Uncharacterized protein n=1 Tax=Tribonema minus TaxID=303371 RepID=A0A835ZAA0_9STRA|nr:hypothetical protein JKP88DRAFT_286796 [Tribonema minus]
MRQELVLEAAESRWREARRQMTSAAAPDGGARSLQQQQTVPAGTWSTSCTNVTYAGGVLTADCASGAGAAPVTSSVAAADGDTVENRNGVLFNATTGMAGTGATPGPSNMTPTNGPASTPQPTSTGTADPSPGGTPASTPQPTSTGTADPSPGGTPPSTPIGGTPAPSAAETPASTGWAPALPQGDYAASCTLITYDNGNLSALCIDALGAPQFSSVYAQLEDVVVNSNGALINLTSPATAPPTGAGTLPTCSLRIDALGSIVGMAELSVQNDVTGDFVPLTLTIVGGADPAYPAVNCMDGDVTTSCAAQRTASMSSMMDVTFTCPAGVVQGFTAHIVNRQDCCQEAIDGMVLAPFNADGSRQPVYPIQYVAPSYAVPLGVADNGMNVNLNSIVCVYPPGNEITPDMWPSGCTTYWSHFNGQKREVCLPDFATCMPKTTPCANVRYSGLPGGAACMDGCREVHYGYGMGVLLCLARDDDPAPCDVVYNDYAPAVLLMCDVICNEYAPAALLMCDVVDNDCAPVCLSDVCGTRVGGCNKVGYCPAMNEVFCFDNCITTGGLQWTGAFIAQLQF